MILMSQLPQKQLAVQIELVPATSWYQNLRKILPRETWDKIRFYVHNYYENKCAICRASGILHYHEIWIYDDEKHIQKLKGFTALCQMCHSVKHIGLAEIRASRGELDLEKIVRHFMKVNNCDRRTFEQHKQDAFEKWEKRSKHKWTLDFGKLAKKIINPVQIFARGQTL